MVTHKLVGSTEEEASLEIGTFNKVKGVNMFSHFGIPELALIFLLVTVFGLLFTVVPYWFIFKKAGFHPALSLLMIIPFADVIMRFFLAFADWPSVRKPAA